tara:strand:- start:3572 stop:3967 length:396 start_codon:yes stop_codon:yes gene_type:complete
MTEPEILEDLSVEEFKELLKNLNNKQVLLVKFSAEWCNPCKKIKPLVERKYKELPKNVIIVEIDIDESLDLYMIFKSKKMLTGVPTLFAFHGDIKKEDNLWYVPDRTVSGSNEKQVEEFMNHTRDKGLTLN